MKIGVFSAWDRKTGVYTMPFYAVTRGQAQRTLADGMQEPNSIVGRHPEDFQLFQVGTFDDDQGEMSSEGRGFVINAEELVPGHELARRVQEVAGERS